jgi:hypothetical protein
MSVLINAVDQTLNNTAVQEAVQNSTTNDDTGTVEVEINVGQPR